MKRKYDVVVIGAGVTGAACARELSRYQARICVLEKEEDVCCGTSKANSGIIHAGYDAKEGSLKAKLNIRGNELMENLSRELDFPFKRNGSLVLCFGKEELPGLEALYQRGKANGVRGMKILKKEEVMELEPNVSERVYAALYAPTAGIVCPFGMNIALAENANMNGADFFFNTEVKNIRKTKEGWEIDTSGDSFCAACVVNAAGVFADRFHNMVSRHRIHITARRGEYCLLDKNAGAHVKSTIFSLPGKLGKGVLVAPTVHGNLLLGPTAADVKDKEGTNTTREGLDQVMRQSGQSVKNLPLRQVITSFAGLRAHEDGDDFVIGEPEDADGFIDCAGIESPGLTSAPAVGEMVAELIQKKLGFRKKHNFIFERKGILVPGTLSREEQNALIKKNPSYGSIVCRCEKVTEGEIIDAIRRPLGAKSLDGVKRRTRAGMGRCQSGFCSPRVMEILALELGTDFDKITKTGGNSRIAAGKTGEWQKDGGEEDDEL